MHARQTSCHFNPLPPHGGRLADTGKTDAVNEFQSTPSAWRETAAYGGSFSCAIFQSTPSAWRETFAGWLRPVDSEIFQSTPSAWRETLILRRIFAASVFQSTPSAWRETSLSCSESQVPDHFNPLPPHGGRLRLIKFNICMHIISIHSLRMEGDIEEKKQFALGKAFQSTPSAWRETHIYLLLTFTTFYFNPLPPHGGRLIIRFFAYIVNSISIHSLRMEGDTSIALFDFGISISIHSLRMEGDFLPPTLRSAISISIHSLRMEGDIARFSEHFSRIPFQSTPSAWRETLPVFP